MKLGELIQGCVLVGFLLFPLPRSALAQANPPGFDDMVLAATAARERDDVPQAIELYSQAVQLKPGWPDGWWFLGSLQYEAEAYAAGRDALTHFLELVPDAAPAWALRGLCEFETGEYSQSLTDIQRGLSLGAGKQAHDEKILRYHEALLLTRSGNFERALQEYAPLTRGKVPNPELLVGIGLAGLRTPLLPRDLRENKQDLYMAAGSAAFLFMSGEEAAAHQEFQKLFQRFPTATDTHYLYGSLLFPTDPDQAIPEFRRELEIAPSNAAAQLMVAWDALMRSDFSTALAYAEKVMAEEPTLPIARLVLGRGLVETGDVKDGIDILEKELRLEPDNFEIHLALARAYSKSGRKEDARRERLLCLQMEKSATTHEARR
jgi:tetratricopeptide (TPR) repeat protein